MIRRTRRPDVVSDVETQTRQAAALAATEHQDLLADARTNPAVRTHHDQLRDAQQRAELDQAHQRALRRGRVADRRAAHAERALEAITTAQDSLSPARAVIALQAGRRRFLTGALLASVALSTGSAMGLAAVSVHTGGPAAAGWLAEVCLTVMTTVAILYRSHIDQASTTTDPKEPTWEGWRHRMLVALVVVPLSVSVAANLAGAAAGAAVSPINALCAVGAGAAGAFAYMVSDVSARAVRANAKAVDATDEDELRREASEGDPFTDTGEPARPARGEGPDAWVHTQAAATAEQIERFLADRGEGPEAGGAHGARPDPAHDGPHDAALDDGGASTERVIAAPAQTEPDQDGARTTERASEAARERGAATREQVRATLARDPQARTADIARELGVHPSTVRRARADLNGGQQ